MRGEGVRGWCGWCEFDGRIGVMSGQGSPDRSQPPAATRRTGCRAPGSRRRARRGPGGGGGRRRLVVVGWPGFGLSCGALAVDSFSGSRAVGRFVGGAGWLCASSRLCTTSLPPHPQLTPHPPSLPPTPHPPPLPPHLHGVASTTPPNHPGHPGPPAPPLNHLPLPPPPAWHLAPRKSTRASPGGCRSAGGRPGGWGVGGSGWAVGARQGGDGGDGAGAPTQTPNPHPSISVPHPTCPVSCATSLAVSGTLPCAASWRGSSRVRLTRSTTRSSWWHSLVDWRGFGWLVGWLVGGCWLV